jgi:lysophospholipase L1-like esterase/fibronectin type 3 domain-containing protein
MMTITSAWRRRVGAMSSLVVAATCVSGVVFTLGETFSVVTPTRIMSLGDSITKGGGSSYGGGYRLPLMQSMVLGRYTSDLVGLQNSWPPWLYDQNHEGYNGYGIDDITRIVAGELNTYHPDYVLLMIGSNDVQWGTRLDTAPDRLSALIDLITNTLPTANLVVASITPLSDPVMDANARVYNAAIPGIVQTKADAGKHVSFVDMYPLLTYADLYDGVHPNDAGYAKLAAAWAQKLATLRATPPAVSTRSCPCSIWNTSDAPSTLEVATTTSAEVGVKFRTEKDGFITAVRFYKGPDNAGPHEARLWKAISDSSTLTDSSTTMTGEMLANGTVTNETSSGWQEVVFATPVPVQANALYFATYYAPFGRYAADPAYFRDREIVHSPVRLPSQGSIDGNGFIREGSPGLPQPSPQGDTNYWVDVAFMPVPPAAPATVTATAVSSSQINVAWGGVADATGYRVERSTNGTAWAGVANTTAGVTAYNDTGLQASSTYYYRVVATNAGADSPPSSVATATTQAPPPTTPPAPASLTATAISSGRIDLVWSDVAGETGYRVERSTGGGSWAAIATTAANVTSYSDTGLASSTTYSYRVVATNGAGDSPPSPSASATTQAAADATPPTAPTGLKAAAAKGKANLSWTGSTDTGGSGLAGYRVWRSTSGASGSFTMIGTTAGTSYSDSAVTGNVDYWYRVTAVDGAGNQSQPSNVVSARPK